MKRLLVGLGLAVMTVGVAEGQTPKYGAKATVEKNVDFAKFTTYSWTLGQPSVHRQTDQQIIAAIDRELSNLGMKKVTQGPADVLVSYASMTRTDVDLKGKPDANGARPQLRVGTLVVSLLDRDNRQPLLRIRVDQPMETDPAKLEEEINKAVAAAFAEYPSRKRK